MHARTDERPDERTNEIEPNSIKRRSAFSQSRPVCRRYVVDTGRMKQNEYDAATSMQQLVEARPSDRRGRAIRRRGPPIMSRGRAVVSRPERTRRRRRGLRVCVCVCVFVCLPAWQVWTPKANARQRRGRAGRVQARSLARSSGGGV
jgi:hypothetical protein